MHDTLATLFESLRIRNFRLYFFGQAISLAGTWMQAVALAWLVLKLTNSGTQLGLIISVQFLPTLLFGVQSGVLIDRYPKRQLLIITQSVSAVLALLVGLLVLSGWVQVWHLYIAAFLLGMVNAVDNPTRQAFAVELVGKEEAANAISWNSAEISLARVLGPALAGILILKVGIAACFLLNTLSFSGVLTGLLMIRPEELHQAKHQSPKPYQLREGLRYVNETPILRNTLLMMVIMGTFTYEFPVILPLLARYTFNGNAGTLALLSVALGVGSIIGSFVSIAERHNPYKKIVWLAGFFGLAMLVAALAPDFSLELVAMVVVGATASAFSTMGSIALQMRSSAEMRGRVSALWTVAFLGSTPVGGPIIGWISQQFTPALGLAIGGVAALVAALLVLEEHKKDLVRAAAEA